VSVERFLYCCLFERLVGADLNCQLGQYNLMRPVQSDCMCCSCLYGISRTQVSIAQPAHRYELTSIRALEIRFAHCYQVLSNPVF